MKNKWRILVLTLVIYAFLWISIFPIIFLIMELQIFRGITFSFWAILGGAFSGIVISELWTNATKKLEMDLFWNDHLELRATIGNLYNTWKEMEGSTLPQVKHK